MTILEKLLLDAMEKCDIDHAGISAEIAKLALKLKEINNTKAEYIYALQNQCKHPNYERVDGTYSPGGYDHVSEEHYTIECLICGKVLESKCIRGTYA